jgi:hypothetical protein
VAESPKSQVADSGLNLTTTEFPTSLADPKLCLNSTAKFATWSGFNECPGLIQATGFRALKTAVDELALVRVFVRTFGFGLTGG